MLSGAQPLPIVLIVVAVLASLVTRVARWQILFLPNRRVPFSPLLNTLAISYMASTFLPLRAGELVRALFLGQRQRIPVPSIVGTILLEKLFDFLAIGVMLTLLIARVKLPPEAEVAGRIVVTAILLGFGCVIALAVWRAPTLKIVALAERVSPFGLGKRLHLHASARHFAEGTDSLRSPRLWATLLGWTAVTWCCSWASVFGGVLALGSDPGWAAILFVVVLTSTGQAIPSSPGYVGVYHAAAAFALTSFGVDKPTAVGIALVTHAFSYGSLVVVGLIALWTGGYTFEDVLKGVRARAGVTTVTVSPESA